MALAMTDAAEVPLGLGKSLVACLVCRLVKTAEQFLQNGCENCHFLGMDGDRTRCEDCTTTYFSGIISVVEPSTSWTAKWLHLGRSVPGCYAISVRGDLPGHIEDILQNSGVVRYVPS